MSGVGFCSQISVFVDAMSVVDHLIKIRELSSFRRTILKQLVDFALLVYYDVKHAFLVDMCCLTKHVGKIFIDNLNQYFGLNCSILFVLQLGDDIFVVNLPNLNVRHKSLTDIKGFPLTINLSMSGYEKCNNGLVANISELIRQTTTPLFDRGNFYELSLDSLFEDTVGMPCMAGWLLSYACIYRAVKNATTGEAASSSALALTPLCKVSVMATVRISYTNPSNKVKTITKKSVITQGDNLLSASPQCLELLSFTVPQSILDSDPLVCTKFDHAVNVLLEEMHSKINHPSGGTASVSESGAVLIVDHVVVNREVVMLTAVAL